LSGIFATDEKKTKKNKKKQKKQKKTSVKHTFEPPSGADA